jgi:hypothetical protein
MSHDTLKSAGARTRIAGYAATQLMSSGLYVRQRTDIFRAKAYKGLVALVNALEGFHGEVAKHRTSLLSRERRELPMEVQRRRVVQSSV